MGYELYCLIDTHSIVIIKTPLLFSGAYRSTGWSFPHSLAELEVKDNRLAQDEWTDALEVEKEEHSRHSKPSE